MCIVNWTWVNKTKYRLTIKIISVLRSESDDPTYQLPDL